MNELNHINPLQSLQALRPYSSALGNYIKQTPLEYSPYLSELTGAHVWLKLENLQHTGSFKARGAINKLLMLDAEQKARPVVTASTGNHGAAVAFGLRALGLRGIVFVPENASPVKVDAIKRYGRYGTEVRIHGFNVETEIYARRYASEQGLVYISPYNDADVIAGQGSIGDELVQQLPDVDAVFASVGGGGLIAGIAGRMKPVLERPISIVGCLPENSPEMALAVERNQFVESFARPTISDGTAGGFEPGAITFDLCRVLVDDFTLVSEEQIIAALKDFIEKHHLLIEGAAAVALAGFLKLQERFQNQNVVIIICGANISLETLKKII